MCIVIFGMHICQKSPEQVCKQRMDIVKVDFQDLNIFNRSPVPLGLRLSFPETQQRTPYITCILKSTS